MPKLVPHLPPIARLILPRKPGKAQAKQLLAVP